jgi:3-phenylpropionate/cinnamic acid dioxygenase small subunit
MGAGNWESHHAILNLMFRYTECVDQANFDGLSELFAHGQIRSNSMEDSALVGAAVGKFYKSINVVHEDGTLRTRHLTTNVRIDIEEDDDRATARSYFVVLQATTKLPFQPIVGGRYEDRFERVDGEWRVAERVMLVDQIGNVEEHLSFDLATGVPEGMISKD